MNISVPKMFFDTVRHQFNALGDGEVLDEQIRSAVLRWGNNPYSDKIVPRWSCQGHSNKNRDSDFEIIFCTTDDGAEILYRVFEELVKMMVEKYGKFRQASPTFSIAMLSHRDYSGYYPHVIIGISNDGDAVHIQDSASLWEELHNKMVEGKL